MPWWECKIVGPRRDKPTPCFLFLLVLAFDLRSVFSTHVCGFSDIDQGCFLFLYFFELVMKVGLIPGLSSSYVPYLWVWGGGFSIFVAISASGFKCSHSIRTAESWFLVPVLFD